MKIILKDITANNWKEAIKLTVNPEQELFVRSNLYTIAWSKFETDGYFLKGIYANDIMVGYCWFGHDPSDNTYWIRHFMIDKNHQGKGYGEAALRKIVEIYKDLNEILPGEDSNGPRGTEIWLSIEMQNAAAQHLFEKVGFEKTGEIIDYNDEDVELQFAVYCLII